MKYFLILLLLLSSEVHAQWQVVPETDSMQVRSIHVFNDYLFVSYAGTWDGSSSPDAFERLDLNNAYQSLQMVNENGQPFISNDVGCLGTANGQIFGLNYQTIMTSEDNGLHWTETASFVNFPITLLGSGNNLYIGTYRTLYQSENLGSTYSLIYHENYYVNTHTEPLLEYNGDIYSTEAAGLRRNELVINPMEFSQMFKEGNVLYGVANNDNFYRSVDSGITWALVNSHPFGYKYVHRFVSHNGAFYACTNDGIYVSTDHGMHFFDIGNGLPNYVRDIAFHNGNVYASTMIGVYVIAESDFMPSLGIPDEPYTNSLECVYPNPSEGRIYISDSQAHDLKVFDEQGREMPVTCIHVNDRTEIIFKDEVQGSFIMHYVNDQNKAIVQRIVIQK